MTWLRELLTKPQDGLHLDAFNRVRGSLSNDRVNVEFTMNPLNNIFQTITSGTGSITYNQTSRELELSVGGGLDGAMCQHIQKWHNPYTTGQSQLIEMTGVLDFSNIGLGNAEVFLKNGVTGGETIVTQDNWTSNQAGVNWQYSQIFGIDFQSLKVGRVRFFLVKDGVGEIVAEIKNDNRMNTGYWQYPAQPIQWKIYNTATETIAEIGYFKGSNGVGFRYRFNGIQATAKVKAICGTVKSENGKNLYEMEGFPYSVDTAIAPKTVSTTLVPIISIRPKALFNGLESIGLTIPTGFSIQSNNAIRYEVLYNTGLTGASWVSSNNESLVEYDVSATALTGGDKVDIGYLTSGDKNTEAVAGGLLGRNILSVWPDGTQPILTLCAIRTDTNDADVLATLKYKDIY